MFKASVPPVSQKTSYTLLHINILNQMTWGEKTIIDLQMQRATQLQKLTHIVHSRANPETTIY